MSLQVQGRVEAAACVPMQVGGVALIVRDIAAVTAFYRDIIGLAVLAEADGATVLGAGGVGFLELLHRPAALPDDGRSAGLFHTAFLLPSRADLGRWLLHASATGVELEGAADHLVSEAAYLSDPEGNGVEVYADRPASQWSWTGPPGARQVVMANHRLNMPGLIGEATTPWSGAPAGTRVGHVHLRVGDVARATEFYGGVLGLDLTRAWPEAAFLSTGSYHHHVAANVWRSHGAGPRDPDRAGLAWVTMEAAEEPVLAAIARRGHADALTTTGMRDPWGTQIKFTTAQR